MSRLSRVLPNKSTMRKQKKKEHKSPAYLYIKVIMGYILLSLLILGSAFLVFVEWRNFQQAGMNEKKMSMMWWQTNHTFEAVLDLALSEHCVYTSDKEDCLLYEQKCLAAQKELDKMRELCEDSTQVRRIEAAKTILAEKNLQALSLGSVLGDLTRTDSLLEEQIEEIAQKEKAAMRRTTTTANTEKPKKKNIFKRIFGKKDKQEEVAQQNQQVATTNNVLKRLQHLQSDIRERNDSLRQQMEEQADSLQMRNERLNREFIKLMHDFQQTASQQREDRLTLLADMRRQSMLFIILIALVALATSITFFVFIRKDINRRYKERLKLMALNKEKNNLIEQKERMMMALSHELRSPLAAVMGYAELMKDTNDTTISTAKRNILRAARMMQGLLNSLLYYYRLSSGKDRVNETLFLPKSIADELESMFLLAAEEKGIDLHADFEGENVLVSGDKERILQIGQNLMSNAVKFTEEGGVSLLVRYAEGTLLLEVCDTGTGISKEEQNAIYEPFSRLANADVKDGFGLGLSITRKLVALLNGDISLESEVCQGTTFRVTLPLSLATETENESHQESFHFSKDMRMIAVDDDAVVLKLTQRQLERVGLECDTCQNVEELMERLRKREYDLLLTDIKMPGMNGYELLDLLRCSNIGNSKNIPVLAVTAHISRKEEELVKAGFAGCLYKPFSCDELYAAVRHALREKRKQVKSDMDDMEAIDFTPLLANEENGRDMLALLAEQTRKDMESLRRVHDSHDREALADLTHHLLPVWTMLRIDTCLQALRNAYRKDSADWADVARYIDKVIATGEQLVAQAEKGIETYGEEWRRKVRY